MDFWRTVVVLFRRWYITIPAFLVTVGLAGAAYSVVPVQYESRSILVLTTPLTGGTESTEPSHPNPISNPLMNFDQSLALTGSIVIQQLSTAQTVKSLGIVPGGITGYEVNNGSSNPELLESGPFIFVVGTGPSPEQAQDITTRVSAMAAKVLDERQNQLNAPASTHIELQVVAAPTPGQPQLGSPMRAAAGVLGLAGLASLATVYCFESAMTHRRRRRAERQRDAAAGNRPGASDGPGERLALVHANSAPEDR